MDQAACAYTEPEQFFPTVAAASYARDAKAICAGCPVAANCLTYALDHDLDGIWGGLDRPERKRLAKQLKAADG